MSKIIKPKRWTSPGKSRPKPKGARSTPGKTRSNVQRSAIDPVQRIAQEFHRLVALGRDNVHDEPYSSRVVNVVVIARCEADMEGFESIFEQALSLEELKLLIGGLQRIGEKALSGEFSRAVAALKKDGFYKQMNMNKVSEKVRSKLEATADRVVSRIWTLDGKLAALLDENPDE